MMNISIYIHIYICIGRGLALYRQHTHSAFSLFRSRLYNAATLKLASMGCYGPIPERPTCVLHTCIYIYVMCLHACVVCAMCAVWLCVLCVLCVHACVYLSYISQSLAHDPGLKPFCSPARL